MSKESLIAENTLKIDNKKTFDDVTFYGRGRFTLVIIGLRPLSPYRVYKKFATTFILEITFRTINTVG